MNKKRNTLIGFGVLILLALISFPYVVVDKSSKTDDVIELLPLLNEVEIEQENTRASIENEQNLATESQEEINSNNVETHLLMLDKPLETETQITLQQYVIQLVALKNKQKIEELVALLRLNNYDVITEPDPPQDGKLTRLFVGSYSTQQQAEVVIIDLHNLTKLKGFVIAKDNK